MTNPQHTPLAGDAAVLAVRRRRRAAAALCVLALASAAGWYGSGCVDSACGMNPISTYGRTPRARYVAKMRSTIVQSYTGRPCASTV